jgi:hypothetical protein
MELTVRVQFFYACTERFVAFVVSEWFTDMEVLGNFCGVPNRNLKICEENVSVTKDEQKELGWTLRLGAGYIITTTTIIIIIIIITATS